VINRSTNLTANNFGQLSHAGTGKTTLMHRLVCDMQALDKRGYVVNLDPAVMTLPFGANIDIRDTVLYKDVMKEYDLGRNGGILTSLNLFASKFDEVGCYNLFLCCTNTPYSISCVCYPIEVHLPISLFPSSLYHLSSSTIS
jgi:hypothetical protein